MSDKIRVKEHERSKPQHAEQTFLEIPSIAPTEGVNIIDAKKPQNAQGVNRGVKRLSARGEQNQIDKGVKRLGY